MKRVGPIIKLLLLLPLVFLVEACQLVKNDVENDNKATVSGSSYGDMPALVEEIWADRVVPHLKSSGADFADILAVLGNDLDAAGGTFGYRPSSEGSPWNFATRIEGEIVAAKTDTRAATADVDIDGDGRADAVLQLGPVIRGTTLRDVLPFIDFTSFTDQIEFAQLSRALNTKAFDTVLADLSREGLVGKSVTATGAFTMRKPNDTILITPIEIEVMGNE
ncbi:MAG: DUF2291 domain-containing protein [Rhodospirillales bacterium]|nr:DUF2291 domain-containing protein [Rhodospirillales bacterium]